MGIKLSSIFPVTAKVFGANGANIDIIGGLFITLTNPGRENAAISGNRLMYMARNVSCTYISLAALTELGAVLKGFPKIADKNRAKVAASTTE